MRKIFILIMMALSLSAMEPLVNGEWISQHKDDKNLVIIDVSNQDAYNKGHIPNAVQSGLEKYRQKKGKSAYEIRSKKEIETEMRRLGINNDSNVVVYAHNLNPKDLLAAPYIIWALEYFGAKNVALLDGGISSFKNNALSTKTTTNKQGNFNAKVNASMLIDMENVKKEINKTPMIDSRPAVYYFGADKQAVLKRAGHISGASSYPWQYSLNKDNYLKSKSTLSQTIEKGLNLDKNKEIIIYCTGGLEASMNYFVFHKVLGFTKAKLYDSSMLEWANLDDTPMTKYSWE